MMSRKWNLLSLVLFSSYIICWSVSVAHSHFGSGMEFAHWKPAETDAHGSISLKVLLYYCRLDYGEWLMVVGKSKMGFLGAYVQKVKVCELQIVDGWN